MRSAKGLYDRYGARLAIFALVPALIVAVVTYVIVGREPKVYNATATLYVSLSAAPNTSAGTIDVLTSTQLVPTYIQMIKAPVITSVVNQQMARQYPGVRSGIRSVTVSQPQGTNTQLITISVSDTIPGRAAAAANALANAFIRRIGVIETSKYAADERSLQLQLDKADANVSQVTGQIASYQGSSAGLANLRATLSAYQGTVQTLISTLSQFRVNRDALLNSVSVYSPATVPDVPTGSHRLLTAILLGIVVDFLGVAGILVFDYFDDSVRSIEDVVQLVGAPILGSVHRFEVGRSGQKLVVLKNPRSQASEAYRLIRTNLQFQNVDNPPRTLVITSALPAEGKTTTICNLGVVMAEAGQQVTLVDADLRNPGFDRWFDIEPGDGLMNLLLRGGEVNGHGAHPSGHPLLTVISAGSIPPTPADALNSAAMQAFLKHTKAQSGCVLLDTPPLLAAADATILSATVDGVILVVDPGVSKMTELRRARDMIQGVGGNIVGVVINRPEAWDGDEYSHRYYRREAAAPTTR
jgi:capsular exopolysaccharide synthesis family protein